MYEEFSVTITVGPWKRFIFTDNKLIYGDTEYPYSLLSRVNIINVPSALQDGIAEVIVNGKALTLYYSNNDKERFASVMTYVNVQIDSAHGVTKNYKYILQSPTGSKVEVYDDYLTLYFISTQADGIIGKARDKAGGLMGKAIGGIGAIGKSFSNTMKGGGSTEVIMFADLISIQVYIDSLVINEKSIPVRTQDVELAIQIVAYIEEAKNKEKVDTSPQAELWEPIQAEARTFPFFGLTFEVPKELDAYNSYKLRFRDYATKYADNLEKEYIAKIHDFVTYIEFFPRIYIGNLRPLIQKATDILISEHVWTVTFDSFMEQHLEDFHNALDDYDVSVENIRLTAESNQQSIAGLTSLVPNLAGFGFGAKSAAKSIAKAQLFNIVRDGVEDSLIKNASNISPAQQHELFCRVSRSYLVECAFIDYLSVHLSLISTLNRNGHTIWWQAENKQANNIFQNLTNPNFPQDKVLEAMVSLLERNPYNTDYYKFIISKFGDTDEVTAIRHYFGLTDFNNPRIF